MDGSAAAAAVKEEAVDAEMPSPVAAAVKEEDDEAMEDGGRDMRMAPAKGEVAGADEEAEELGDGPTSVAPPPPQPLPSLRQAKAAEERAGEGEGERFELPEESRKAMERQEQLFRDLEARRRARALAVPTNDGAVRQRLRGLGEPVTLFGEKEMERRDRLRQLMAAMDAQGEVGKLVASVGDEEAEEELEEEAPKAELFYTEGSAELLHMRSEIANFSLPRAAARIAQALRKRDNPDEDIEGATMDCSEIGDERPLSDIAISPDQSRAATCSWTGMVKLWALPSLGLERSFRAHCERVTSVAFNPAGDLLASASADRTACLWDLKGQCRQTFRGHIDRLARLAFHPSGRYVGTASFDKTWRMWDVETGTELLLQEGHSRSVYGIAFQCDGSLAATCGLDALMRVWDLRTGKSIMACEGHVKPLLAVDFSPNGYHAVTGGEDHTCRVWDLRRRSCLYVIPAHASLISQIKYEPQGGYFLITASYDHTARIWSGRDFKAVKTLAGHEGKVMGVDLTPEGQCIATVAYDRTVKLWVPDKRPRTTSFN